MIKPVRLNLATGLIMWILVILVIFALAALSVVSAINHVQEKERIRRFQQRKLKIQVDALTDLVNGLEQTLPNTQIIKLINDEIIGYLKQSLALEKIHSPYLENLIRMVLARSADLSANIRAVHPSYQKESDTQIAQAQSQLTEAAKWIRHLASLGRIKEEEVEIFLSDLTWSYLMVAVTSYIAQGTKLTAEDDLVLAETYYQKAQNLLMESMHPDPRRLKMIRELGEILHGSRKYMSVELMAAT